MDATAAVIAVPITPRKTGALAIMSQCRLSVVEAK